MFSPLVPAGLAGVPRSTTCAPSIGDVARSPRGCRTATPLPPRDRHRHGARRPALGRRRERLARCGAAAGDGAAAGRACSPTSIPPDSDPGRDAQRSGQRFRAWCSASLPVAPAARACRQQRRGPARHPRMPADLVRPGIFLYGGAAGGMAPEPVARAVRAGGGDRVDCGGRLGELRRHAGSRRGPTTVATLGDRLCGRGAAIALQPWRGRAAGAPVSDRRAGDDGHDHGRVGRRAVGDVATVFGGLVTLDEQAVAAGTISYELLTSLSAPDRAPLRRGSREQGAAGGDHRARRGGHAGRRPTPRAYGDTGSDTLGNVARAVGGLTLPNLEAAGAGALRADRGRGRRCRAPTAAHGVARAGEPGEGQHDRALGAVRARAARRPFPTYPRRISRGADGRVLAPHRTRRAGQPGRIGHRRSSTSSVRSTCAPAAGSSTPRPTASSRSRRTRRRCRSRSCTRRARIAREMLAGRAWRCPG